MFATQFRLGCSHAGFGIVSLLLLGGSYPAWACSNDLGGNLRVEFNFSQADIHLSNDLAPGSVIARGAMTPRELWVLRNCVGRRLTRTLAHRTYAGYPNTYKIPGVEGIGYRIRSPKGYLPQPVQNIQFTFTRSGVTDPWSMELIKLGAFNSTAVTVAAGKYASMDLSGYGNLAGFFLPRNLRITSTAKPCTVSSSNNLTIELGRIGVTSLASSGATGPWKDGQAKIVATSCPAGTRTLNVRFSGEADARDGTLFKNVGGTAGNVAIRFSHQGVRAVSPGASSSVAVQNGRAEMPLTAQFVATGAATAGTVVSRVTATMTYQ